MIVASSQNDSVAAYSTETGEEKWRFFANGPVRLAPVADKGRAYFGSDDGYVYCLQVTNGSLLWKFRAAVGERRVIGNERLIPVWPVRGGLVLDQGKLTFTVGVWPFEGTFLYTLDAATGKPVSKEVGLSGRKALRDIAPQGYLAIAGKRLYLPQGRGRVYCMDRITGSPVSHKADSRGLTDYHVVAQGPWLFHGHRIYHMDKQKLMPVYAPRPVVTEESVYAGYKGAIYAYNLKEPAFVTKKDRKGKPYQVMTLATRWSLANPLDREIPKNAKARDSWHTQHPLRIDILAGQRLYGHQDNEVFCIAIPKGEAKPSLSWKVKVNGMVSSMMAADNRLFVVTKEGSVYCFGAGKKEPKSYAAPAIAFSKPEDGISEMAEAILGSTGQKNGYAIVLGLKDGRLTEELARQSDLQLIGIDADAKKVDAIRHRLNKSGLYGSRITILRAEPLRTALPPYIANLVVSEAPDAFASSKEALAKQTYQVLRPYGGTACFALPDKEREKLADAISELSLPQKAMAQQKGMLLLARKGALPGSGNWTHEYGDSSNTLFASDKLVKAPLGLLWWGGPAASGKLFYDRHDWGPSMAVIDGRMFIQGPGVFTAVDVYTGRILWQKPLPKRHALGRLGNFATTGFHFVALGDSIYLNDAETCLRIDPATGRKLGEFSPPAKSAGWGRMRVWKNYLLMTVFQTVVKKEKRPTELVAIDRLTGKQVWSKKATLGFPLFALGKDFLFCFDGAMPELYNSWKRKGKIPKAMASRSMVALDLRSGRTVWEQKTSKIVTWLSVSPKHNIVISSNKNGIVARRGETGSVVWKKEAIGKGFKGHPESVWDKVILWKDRVIDQRGPGLAYHIQTGKPVMRKHPITGKMVPWEFTKEGHHCNYAIANEHLMTFRAADAGFCDLSSSSTSRLKGFRSGCRNSLIPANGVLNAPNMAHGCICGYSLFTSMAFVHVPQAEMWSYSAIPSTKADVKQLGINLGAPGDRVAENGTLWLDYPSVGGRSPAVKFSVVAQNRQWFRRLGEEIEGNGLKWVAASGLEGIKELSLSVNAKLNPAQRYTVSLTFMEPLKEKPGERLFDVHLQGKEVLRDFDIYKEANGSRRIVVKEFRGVEIDRLLKITFQRKVDRPVLCGVEVIAEPLSE